MSTRTARSMSADVVRLDPRLARLRVRSPRELAGVRVVGCVRVSTSGPNHFFINALFALENGARAWATTEVGAKTWSHLRHRDVPK